MRFSAVLVAVFACCSLAAGCAQPPDAQNPERTARQAGGPTGDRPVELPQPKQARYGGPNWPPPVWLVSGEKVVQASYGEFCVSDMCGGEVVPKQIGEPVTAEFPAGDPAMVVVGRDATEDLDLVPGVVGWEDLPNVDNFLHGVSNESGVPYFMRELDVRREPEEEKPAFRLPGEKPGAGLTVFELSSTGNTGDRLLSVFLTIGDDPASYHLRLAPGQQGENPPPSQEEFPVEVAEISPTPETVTRPAGEAERKLAVDDVAQMPLGESPTRVEFGEGYLWVLDGPRLLKVDPATARTVSTTGMPNMGGMPEVGAGAVWIADQERGTVLRLDPESGKVLREIPVRGTPSEIVATGGGVWVANGVGTQDGNLTNIDPKTNEVVAEIETPGIAESVAVDENTGDAWAVSLDQTKGYIDYENNQLVRVDAGREEISARYRVDGGVSGVISTDGQVWVVNDDLNRIVPQTGEVRTIVPLKPSDPYRMEVAGDSLWSVGAGDVALMDLRAGRTLGSLKLGEYDTEDVAVGGGAVWIVGAGTGEGGTLTRITP